MYKSVYEEHGIAGNDIPLIFHFANTSVNLHWHTNIEILCCIHGKGIVHCDSEKYFFQKGDIFVVNSECIHGITNEAELVYHCLIIDKKFFEDNGFDFDKLKLKSLITDKKLYDEFNTVMELSKIDGKNKVPVIKHRVLGLLIMLCEKYSEETENKASNPSSERIKTVIKFIKKNISSELSLAEIAASVGISKYHLTREFKKYTNTTVFECINILRCNEAKRLIKEGMSVSAAALSSGFSNMSYFTRTYKKYIGKLPSENKSKVL